MIETCYSHLQFKNRNGEWSINLPFLCTKCGVCCTLEDFLMAGETRPNKQLQVKIQALFEELGKRWQENEDKYDDYIAHSPCPFLVNTTCSIYEYRPEGCRLFPITAFGMQTQDCPALNRFKRQRLALRKGRASKETYHLTTSPKCKEPIEPVRFTEKQYSACLGKLYKAGVTNDELALFNLLNGKCAGKD